MIACQEPTLPTPPSASVGWRPAREGRMPQDGGHPRPGWGQWGAPGWHTPLQRGSAKALVDVFGGGGGRRKKTNKTPNAKGISVG